MPLPLDPQAHPALAELVGRLRELAGDASYVSGRDYFKKGLVKQPSVAGTKAYATVTGSTDYRVTIDFTQALAVHCTCPAHRRSKYCKHVVAVCSALLERPGDFTPVSPMPAAPAPGRPAKKAAGSGGRKKAAEVKAELRGAGLETVDRLLAELAAGGLMTLGPDKAAMLAAVGELARSLKLRRLGNLVLRLQRAVSARTNPLTEHDFADLLTDLYLTHRAVSAHLEGRVTLDPREAEDLLGKTWREEELQPVAGLSLLEIARTWESDSEFQVTTSYLADITDGTLYTDKLIAPVQFAGAAKPRLRQLMLVDEAGLYPGRAPRRLKLRWVRRDTLTADHVGQWLGHVPATVADLRRCLVERLREPFGTPDLPVCFRPAALVTQGDLVGAVDVDGYFVGLTWPDRWRSELPSLLPESGQFALFGRLKQTGRGLQLQCLSLISPALRWAQGPVYPDAVGR